jgi:hypothetical protein
MSIRVFHEISDFLKQWMDEQPHVKEESLTDWMLYQVSLQKNNIKYHATNRHEEAKSGEDWVWWLLMPNSAYCFSVQAKKLKGNNKDNWAAINYCNDNGAQIDLLLDKAVREGTYPLYLLYSITNPNTKNQLVSFHDPNLQKMIEWCKTCENGSFISPAFMVADLINNNKRFHLDDEKLLDISICLSSLDWLENHFTERISEGLQMIEKLLNLLEQEYAKSKTIVKKYQNNKSFKYFYQESNQGQIIPGYLQKIISYGNIPKWFSEDPPRDLPSVDGIGIIDLRETI